jgi:hypothetical protein
LASPRLLFQPHGTPSSIVSLLLCFISLSPQQLGGRLGMLQPLDCFGQTRASRPPPLQHRAPHTRRADDRGRRRSRRHTRIAPGAFSVADRTDAFSTQRSVPHRPFKPRGLRTSYEPRSVLTTSLWTPTLLGGSYGVLQPLSPSGGTAPPAGHCWLQAESETVVALLSPGRTFEGVGRVAISPTFIDSRAIRFCLAASHTGLGDDALL